MDLVINGLAQVQQQMRDLAPYLVVRSFARALDRGAGVIAAEIEQRAEQIHDGSETPLSEHVITRVQVDTQKNGGVATVGFDSSIDERSGITQDLKAMLVELGHRQVTHRPKKREVGHVPAHPFVRPAFDLAGDRAVQVFGETLAEELGRE
jgi:hypothetical protein